MMSDRILPNEFTFPCVLKLCGKKRSIKEGFLVHNQIICRGLELCTVIWDAIIDMYIKCKQLELAIHVFKGCSNHSLVAWSTMIGGCTQNDQGLLALELFQEMQGTQLQPDMVIFSCVLKACCSCRLLKQGKFIHDQMIRSEVTLDVVAQNILIDLYAKNGLWEDAKHVFYNLAHPTLVSWGALLNGYLENGQSSWAFEALQQMRTEGIIFDKVIYLCAVKACTDLQSLRHGKSIHNQVLSTDLSSHIVIKSALISMYVRCGKLEDGFKILQRSDVQDAELWDTMLNVSILSEAGSSVADILTIMHSQGMKPSRASLISILRTCSDTDGLNEGRLIHHQVVCDDFDLDTVVGNSLVSMYVHCSRLADARGVFDKLQTRTVVSWSSMIFGYSQHVPCGRLHIDEMFEKMRKDGITPDNYIYSCALKACAMACSLIDGKWVHNHLISNGLEVDLVLGCTIVDMYAKCGELEEACRIFTDLERKDIVLWGAIIAGCVRQGSCALALRLYSDMRKKDIEPNAYVLSSLLKACGLLGTICQGMFLHDYIMRHQLEVDLYVESALIDLYVKCNCINEAISVQKFSQGHNIVSWGALISGYAQVGNSKIALESMEQMQQLHGLIPNEAIYANTLSAYGHTGEVKKGHQCFNSMIECQQDTFHLKPYNYMADVYARAGYLKEAAEILNSLPAPSDIFGWVTLYSPCSLQVGQGQYDNLIHQVGTDKILQR
ncbi:hypothetical protein KP509_05G076200 [Ceratopteris richardii]|nr:hypothetical protein KP509_05G076200 [Ceratopteris richardii]